MVESVFVTDLVGELDTGVGQHRVDGVGNRCDEIAQELRRDHLAGFEMELGEGKPGSPVNGHKEIELALGRLHLGDIDVKVAPSRRCFASPVGQGIG